IKERPVITWLLNTEISNFGKRVAFVSPMNPANYEILNDELFRLKEVRSKEPEWGLPQLVMPSFKKIMEKSTPAFHNLFPSLLEEFSKIDKSGILIFPDETLVYGFGGGQLYIWDFVEQNNYSQLVYSYEYDVDNGKSQFHIPESILYDENLFGATTIKERLDLIERRCCFIVLYEAVKKYVKVETVIIPKGTFKDVEGTPLEYVEKKKVINQSGQEVIVMDSKWFKKIINDNEIPVRGFFRMQNKKNDKGEWFKELIFVEPFIRHGYHRDAKIEDE
ncbi:MAG: hypothetical protein K2M52_02345, partial [Paramuribaculum sp.]|nr:hypothetical protein [Paramuribaculum sp.]